MDSFSCSDNFSTVISKYFSTKLGMDESLSDFQEKKSSCTGPKNVSKQKLNPKKKSKHIKGQRDIRTLVKSKKNELLKYTEDFNQICKHSAIDVDSEQLQLAIALSKSLQDSQSQIDTDTETVKPLTSQERLRKIKLTLKEYGFKVPNGVLKNPTKKKISNKKYKLLLTPDTEKLQIIKNKYAEVLIRNSNSTTHCLYECDYTNKEIYHKTTSIPYSNIKNVKVFYVPNLIEITNQKSCLLRDWSEIPGRPVSPEPKISNFKFDELDFTQEELDCILSCPLQLTQEIIKNKSMTSGGKENIQAKVEANTHIHFKSTLHNIDFKYKNKEMCSLFVNLPSESKNVCKARSESPDLFDEDDDSIMESETNHQMHITEIKTNTIDTEKISFMDLTECVNNESSTHQNIVESMKQLTSELPKRVNGAIIETDILVSNYLESEKDFADNVHIDKEIIDKKELSKSSQRRDTKTLTHFNSKLYNQSNNKNLCSETVRDINDFMEVTECVISDFNHQIVENIDLALDKSIKIGFSGSMSVKERSNIDIEIIDFVSEDVQSNISNISLSNCISPKGDPLFIGEKIDLTQAANVNMKHIKESIPLVKDFSDNIETTENNHKIETVTMDLTQSSNSNDDLPLVQLSGKKGENLSDSTIVMYYDDTSYNDSSKNIESNTSIEVIQSLADETQINNISQCEDQLCGSNMVNKNKDFDISSGNLYIKSNKSILDTGDNTVNIDLTQSPKLSPQTFHSTENLGKQNNISIDYDDLYDNIISNRISESGKHCTSTSENFTKNNNSDTIEKECLIYDDEIILNCSQNYSKSRHHEDYSSPVKSKEYFDFISTKDNLSNEANKIQSKDDAYLPNIKFKTICKNTEVLKENNNSKISPIKLSDLNYKPTVQTPETDQYIIKTDNVTPILDYESMTTPARNKELEKYGIKPFKRKRAIQLLTYIYNQTHPVVEQGAMDEMPSTSKKLKFNEHENKTKKTSISPQKTECIYEFGEMDLDKENYLYTETKPLPDIKEIDCCPEEWVFQTREKAKVHSCRVPLHIVFHNYVSCRNMLRTAILRYEPINIDIIHKDLVASGFRYNPKELLKFMDKRCITVKTTENNTRNKKI